MSKCKSESCDRDSVIRGYCRKCYKREKRKGTIVNVEMENIGFCIKDGCSRPKYVKGLCEKHYRQIQRTKNSVKCSVEGCEKPNIANGLCEKHYSRVYRGNSIQDPIKINRTCSVDGCTNDHHANGLCIKHYGRVRRHGSVNLLPRICKYATTEEKMEARRQVSRLRRYQKRSRSGSLSEKWTKAQVVEKSNGICSLCGEPIDMTLKSPNKLSFSIDHIVPLSKGGSNLFDNVQAAHLFCNSSKNNRVR